MKTRALQFLVASTCFVACVTNLSAQLAGLPSQPQIQVSGSAEIRVVPDEIRIHAGVETRNESLAAATQQHDETMRKVLAFLKATGLPEKDVQTDFVSVVPEFVHTVSRTTPAVYVVRKSVEFRLTTVTNIGPILSGLLTNGANHIHNVELRTTALRKHRDAARAMAIRAAREKATALAAELGVGCGKPLAINAQEWGGTWSSYGGNWGNRGHLQANYAQNAFQELPASTDSNDTLSLGQVSVSATVNVTFALE